MTIFVPPEWATQKAIWTGWPSHPDLWLDNLEPARRETAAMILALAKGQPVKVLVMGENSMAAARAALPHPNVELIPARFGDMWQRDSGLVFARENGKPVALHFRVNGWGGKYVLPHDDEVAGFIASRSGTPSRQFDFVLEGGSIEVDDAGNLLTTRQCLLNPNRNPGMSQTDMEAKLREAFGVEKILWLDRGLLNDHTDGHIDNIARFIAKGHVVCQSPSGHDDPNRETLDAIARDLEAMGMEVARIPSPGLILSEDGEPVPASHVNYIIGNKTVVMPVYEAHYSEMAAEALKALFPGRDIIALPANHILTGGGAFHCMTQQEPE
ncbi:MAG: agmatine deiminase family protein [Alphaproteobacteria bacterium]